MANIRFTLFVVIVSLGLPSLSCSDPVPTVPFEEPVLPADQGPEEEGTAAGEDPLAPAFSAVYDRVTPTRSGSPARYVFHEDGSFELQYIQRYRGVVQYDGDYSQRGSTIDFAFDVRSSAGPMEAIGILDGDYLEVKYNVVMFLTDFEDGLYVLRTGG